MPRRNQGARRPSSDRIRDISPRSKRNSVSPQWVDTITGPESRNPMNGLLQSISPFQGPYPLRPQGATEFVNNRAGSLWGPVSNLPKKEQVENLSLPQS